MSGENSVPALEQDDDKNSANDQLKDEVSLLKSEPQWSSENDDSTQNSPQSEHNSESEDEDFMNHDIVEVKLEVLPSPPEYSNYEDEKIKQCELSFQDWGAHICGAAIISSSWALSAAHCFKNSPYPRLRSGTAQLGVGGSVHEVDEYILHELFDEKTLDNDIALLHVASPFQFGFSVQPIGLPSQGEKVVSGSQAVVSGWGHTSATATEDSPVLLYLSTTVFSSEQCNSFYSDYGGLQSGMICAGYAQGGKDACQGDSGGPLASGGKLIGVVSWGDGCAKPGRPGVYTDVAAYRLWISNNSGV